ncbi:MAG: hypothetical protein PHS57_01100 [Alphaproteobacteria bacterium]|nr:hypothetical protein [Alphaproteobacteria bacterium]
MSHSPKPISKKQTADSDGSLEKDLSVSELRALHKRLVTLRSAANEAGSAKENNKSVRALIAFAACDFGVNEDVVDTLVKGHFQITNTNELNENNHDELIDFLENLDIKQFIN